MNIQLPEVKFTSNCYDAYEVELDMLEAIREQLLLEISEDVTEITYIEPELKDN